jgi:excisionase family DNA binding protein
MDVTISSPLTTSQAARRLELSREMTVRLAREGKLAHYWTPLGRLYPVDAVERLAKERSER